MQGKIGFFIGFIFLGFLALLLGGPLPYFLLYALGALFLLPMVHSLLGILSIRGQVKVQEGEIYAGDTIEIRYKIWTSLPISFPKIALENQMAYRLAGKRPAVEIFSLVGREEYYNQIKITCWRRGDYTVGHLKIKIGDILNLFTFSKTIAIPVRIRVYPRIIPIQSLSLKPIIPLGDIWVENRLLQDYTEISDLKPYQEGDNIKKIHWKASAKQEALLVKNFEPRGDTKVRIFINASSKSYEQDPEGLMADKAVEMALSIASHCLRQGILVAVSYGNQGQDVQIQGNHLWDLKAFMDQLVLFQPKETLDFSSQVIRYSPALSQGETVVLITPTVDKDLAVESIHWRMRGVHPIYIVLKDNLHADKEANILLRKLRGEGIQVYKMNHTTMEELSLGLEESK